MTVEELIETLKTMPQDAVVLTIACGDGMANIEIVYTSVQGK